MRLKVSILILVGTFLSTSFAALDAVHAGGLVINAAEMGVGKFHRKDNSVHPYGPTNAWTPFIMPVGYSTSGTAIAQADGSYTIFFSNLQELLSKSVEISKKTGQKIQILNINGHGMPGGMWYPKDQAQQDSRECQSWRDSASGDDDSNYEQYYSPVSKQDVMMMRQISQAAGTSGGLFECVTGTDGWRQIVPQIAGLKEAFAADAQIHFLSCIVGLGKAGENFTKGVAETVLTTAQGRVMTSLMFGLGDWSIEEGMSFWDYQTDDQLAHDSQVYPAQKRDRDIMQKGTVRVAALGADGHAASALRTDVDFMLLSMMKNFGVPMFGKEQTWSVSLDEIPARVRIPGTTFYVDRIQ
jgi:hypothetical protein